MSSLQEQPMNTSPLQALSDHLAMEMNQVDQVILQSTQSNVTLIPQIAQHLILAGGKRIRPLLALASNKLFGLIHENAIYLSAAIEFIHTATLLHDDVVDESELRRNQPAANILWGNAPTILVGDFLFARAFELMVRCQNLDILKVLSCASSKIAAGEVLQLQYCQNFALTKEIALDIIGAKTAELFAAACHAGSAVAGASLTDTQAMYHYGYYLGMIFQITDDILDYTSAERGKIMGDDFREGKITLPVLFAYENCNAAEQEFLRHLIQDATLKESDLKDAVHLLETKDGFGQCYQLADQFAHQAFQVLNGLPRTPIRTLLADVVTECLERKK